MKNLNRLFRVCILLTLFFQPAGSGLADEKLPDINVYLKVRGQTGKEPIVRSIMVDEFNKCEYVKVIDEKKKSHLYVDVTLIEQDPIRYFGMGVAISYYIKDDLYSRPTSDVAQFGEDRMDEVCRYLARQIDRGFLEPLREPVRHK